MGASTLEFLADHREARVDVLTDLLVRTIETDNAGYREVPVVPPEDLRRSCHDNIARVLELLERAVAGDRAADGPWYDAAEETGHRRASQGLPLDDVLGSFRIGGRLIWEDLVAQSERDLPLEADQLREIGTRLWEVVDRTSSHVARAYHATERALAREDEQRTAALWEELIGGRTREPAFAAAAAQALGLPLDGHYVALILSTVAGDVESVLATWKVASAWYRRTDSVAGLLALGEVEAERALQVLARDCSARGSASGVTSFADLGSAFAEAQLAMRAVTTADTGVVAFDDRLVEALLLAAPDVAARMARRWLGPVLVLPAAERRSLLATLQAWAAAGGSVTRTAELAHCHRNTALNRLSRIAELVGVPLATGVVPVEIELALRWQSLHAPD